MKRIATAVSAAVLLTACAGQVVRPVTPPASAPAMWCGDAHDALSVLLEGDPDKMSGEEIRRSVLAADAVILANTDCFDSVMVSGAVATFTREGLDPSDYGYRG